VYIYIM